MTIMKKLMKTIILLLTLCALQLNAQFTLYTPENSDLQSTYFSNIVIDFENVIWLGSSDGLVKIENNEFTLYNSSNSELPTEAIVDMYIDTKGILWLLYEEQIYKKQNNKFVFVKSIEYGKKIAVDRNGDLIFGSNMSLLKLKSDLSIDTLYKSDMLDHKSVSRIIVDMGNNIWFTRSFDDGIRKITSDSTFYYGRENIGLPISFSSQLTLDSLNNIWLGGLGQLYKYNQNEDEWTNIITDYSDKIEDTWAYNGIAFNRTNTPIVSSRNRRANSIPIYLHIFHEVGLESFQLDSFYLEDDFKSKSPSPIAIDLNNNVWIHISDVGLLKFDPSISSVNLLPKSTYTIYPNPTTSSLSVELENEALSTSYIITDTKGKQVLTGSLSPSNLVSIDVEQLTDGVYIIELTTSSGEVVIDKFVKE